LVVSNFLTATAGGEGEGSFDLGTRITRGLMERNFQLQKRIKQNCFITMDHKVAYLSTDYEGSGLFFRMGHQWSGE